MRNLFVKRSASDFSKLFTVSLLLVLANLLVLLVLESVFAKYPSYSAGVAVAMLNAYGFMKAWYGK